MMLAFLRLAPGRRSDTKRFTRHHLILIGITISNKYDDDDSYGDEDGDKDYDDHPICTQFVEGSLDSREQGGGVKVVQENLQSDLQLVPVKRLSSSIFSYSLLRRDLQQVPFFFIIIFLYHGHSDLNYLDRQCEFDDDADYHSNNQDNYHHCLITKVIMILMMMTMILMSMMIIKEGRCRKIN